MYSLASTEVINSRRLARRNEVWRRRKNDSGVVFTTRESVDTSQLKVLRDKKTESFNQGALFLSIFKACDHLDKADQAAWHLTQTVVSKLLPEMDSETTTPQQITETTYKCLRNYDKLAADKYQSYRS